jgi:hypothetical protein
LGAFFATPSTVVPPPAGIWLRLSGYRLFPFGEKSRQLRKKPGFAGVPSRQEKNPMLCMDFFLGATA